MNILKDKVAAAVSSMSSRKVLIIDDEQPYVDVPPPEAWVELKEALQQVPSVYDAFVQLTKEQGHRLDEAPTVATIQLAIQRSKYVGADLTEAVAIYSRAKHILAEIRDLLRGLGFDVSIHSRTPELDKTAPPFLVIVDFHFEGEAYEGQNAERTISALMPPSLLVPPFVLLMSKLLERTQCERWTSIAERSGFFRFNYDFLAKGDILESPAHLYFPLLNFVEHAAMSQAYFRQMQTLESQTKRVVETVTKELFQVTPPEAQLFRERMQHEGMPLSRVFTDLFINQLGLRLTNSAEVVSSMTEFERTISAAGIPAAEIRECGTLHRLFSEQLHQQVSDNGIPAFGDIYKGLDGKLFLILSQECDIASGERRPPKVDRVLALEGTIEISEADKNDGPIISKPYCPPGGAISWLWWNLGKPQVIPFSSFSANSLIDTNPQYKKILHLRFSDADEIQNAFSFHLARVGAGVMPPPVQKFSVTTGSVNEAGEIIEGAKLSFYKLRVNNENFISLCPESKVAALGNGPAILFSVDTALLLSRFVNVKRFCELLTDEKIFPINQDGQLKQLVKYITKKPRGFSEWTGK